MLPLAPRTKRKGEGLALSPNRDPGTLRVIASNDKFGRRSKRELDHQATKSRNQRPVDVDSEDPINQFGEMRNWIFKQTF